MAAGYDGSIRIDSRIDPKGFNSGLKTITGSLKGLAGAIGLAFGTAIVAAFGKATVAAASDMNSALAGLRYMLDAQGRSFEAAKAFINDYVADGLVPATSAVKAYKNLVSRGYDDTQIRQIMTVMKDTATFNRQAAFTMGEAIEKASEGLRNENSLLTDSVGITRNVAKMWQDYAKSIGTTAEKLTLAQKRQAEVNGFMNEGKIFSGAAAAYANTYAGKMAALSASFLNFKVAFGNSLIPVISAITPLIKKAVDLLTIYFNRLSEIMSLLFGVEIGAGVAGMENAADATQAAADAQESLADATERAGKAAKGSLAAFDELNVLAKDEGAGPEAPAGELPVTMPAEIIPPDVISPELTSKVEEFKTKFLEMLAPVRESLGRLKEALTPLGETIWGGLKWAWDNILVPMGKWVISEALPHFLDLLAAGADLLNVALEKLKPFGIWLWENFLKPIAEWSGKTFLDYLDWLTEGLKRVTKALDEGGFGAALLASWEYTTDTIKRLAGKAWDWILDKWDKLAAWFDEHVTQPVVKFFEDAWESVKNFASETWQAIVDKWTNAGGWFDRNVTEPVKGFFSGAWENIKGYASGAWQNVKDTWQGVKDWFKQHVTDPVAGFFDTAWGNIKGYASNAWQNVVDVWGSIGTWITTNVTDPVKTAFETALNWVGEKWELIFGGVETFLKGSINTIIDFINTMISAVAGGINAVIGGMNSISVTIPDWVPGFGGQTWGLAIPYVDAPQIPRLASGAVIPPNSEFAAILGDQRSGRNIETPEALMRQIVREEMGKVEADIRIEFGGSLGALVRELKPRIDKENVRIGGSLIQGGAKI